MCYLRPVTAQVRRDLLSCAAIAVAASLLLLALAPLYQVEHFYVSNQSLMSNDQIGYLTTARWLADTGELRSHLIYPAFVREPRWRLYMPGHYYVLAAGHLLFGDGPIAWRLPAMIGFVVASVGLYLIGRRFHGRSAGAAAALLFMAFPPTVAFAFTAMPQLPFTAACVTAFCLFSYLPARWRAWSIPLLLTGPFLVRETGSFLVIPMAVVSLAAGGWREWRRVIAALACSVVLLYGLLAWQFSSGKGALQLDGSGFNYADAFSPPAPPMTVAGYLQSLSDNLSRNLGILERHAARDRFRVVPPTLVLCALALLAFVRGVRVRPPSIRDALALGGALFFAMAFAMVTVFYTWMDYRGLRTLLFTVPFVAVGVAPSLVSALDWLTRRMGALFPRPVAFVPALLFVGAGVWIAYRGNQELAGRITPHHGALAVERLESLDIDPGGVLVAPFDLSLDYVLRHYPMRWSFIPSNDETFKLLAETYPVKTVILPEWDLADGGRISERAVLEAGLVRTLEFQHGRYDNTYVLFERPGGRAPAFE